MPITSKFLRDLRESTDSDLPTHPSDASTETPETLQGKLGARAVKKELDGSTYPATTGKTIAIEETDDEMKAESAESDLPTHSSAAKATTPNKLSEGEDEDEKAVAESDDADEDDAKTVAESDDADEDEKKAVAESDDADEDDAKTVAESDDADADDELKEEDGKLSADAEDKLSEEEEDEVKEAADALTKDETLPESFKTKVASIFEAAVKRTASKRVAAHKSKLVESYNSKLSTSKKQISETLVNKVDGYLDYVVEEWMKENRVAIEGSLRSEVTEKFIVGLKGLFESHYIEVPAEKTNVITEQERKIKNLETELNNELVKSVELRKENIRLKKSSIIKKLTEGMTTSDAAKFVELCEGVSFDNANTFGQKLKVIKETYFPKTPKSSDDIDASLLTEGGLTQIEDPKLVTGVDIYAQAISRMVKK